MSVDASTDEPADSTGLIDDPRMLRSCQLPQIHTAQENVQEALPIMVTESSDQGE